MTEGKNCEKIASGVFPETLQTAPIVIYEIGPSNRLVRVNDEMVKWSGYSREELLSMEDPSKILTPESREKFRKRIELGLSTGRIEPDVEYDVTLKNGSRRTVVLSTKTRWENGKFLGALVVAYDVTERKKAEEVLRENEQLKRKKAEEALVESEERFRNVADGTAAMIFLTDQKGRSQFINKYYRNFFNIKPEQAAGYNWQSLYHPDDRSEYLKKVTEAVNERKPFVGEARVKRADGVWRWVQTIAMPRFSSSNEFLGHVGLTIDITERKQAEEALVKSEKRYRALFSSIGEAFALHEMLFDGQGVPYDYRFLEVNEAFERQTGLKASEIIGKTVCEILPDLEPFWIEKYGKVVVTGEPVRFDNYNRSLKKYFEVYAFRPFQGKFAAIFTDITERKKVEQSLKEKDAELNCILDSAPTIIFYKDKQGKVIQANEAFARALNVSKEALLGKTVFDLYSPEIAQQMTNDDLAVMRSKKSKIGTVEPYESPTGLRWLRTDKIPSFNDNGEVDGIIGFSEDITERKIAEEKVARLASFPQLNPLPIVEVDFDGNITYCNPAAINLFANLETLDSANPFLADWQNIRDIFSSKRSDTFRREIKVCERWYHEFFYIVPNTQLIRLYAEDITERKELEKQLTDSQRLAAIGATAGMVGHDIRNPLQAVLSDTYLLKDELASEPEGKRKETVAESLDSIERNVDYINKIVRDLQDYAKPIVPEYSIVNLSGVLVHAFETIGVPDSINLSINIKDAEKIRTDATLLQRVITNLVNNAIQAMPDGGKLKICGEKMENRIVVTVSDTGLGIPDEVKPKLFTPMMTTKAKGQGFGLAASKRIIEAMKGTISFESEVGKGTKFTIEMPAA